MSTKEPSKINLSSEGAYFKPGTASGIRDQVDIDNFDTDQSKISLISRLEIWSLASAPGGENPHFPNGDKENDLSSGYYYRGMISWYDIASSFYNQFSTQISKDELSKNMTRQVENREIFTGKELAAGDVNYINTSDLTFSPDTPGPYNFNPSAESPRSRWGGLMRLLTTTNFHQSNVQYLEFWMMDPFADDTGSEGEFLVHLGNVSEDILKDGRQQYENGLPYSGNPNPVLNSVWGKPPQKDPVVYTFDSQGKWRSEQDLGLDGLSEEELQLYGNFSDRIQPVTGALNPSGDNYVYYLDSRWNASPRVALW